MGPAGPLNFYPKGPTVMPQDPQYSRQKAAEYLGIKPGSLDAGVTRGVIPGPDGKIGRTPYWRKSTLDGYAEKRRPVGVHRDKVDA